MNSCLHLQGLELFPMTAAYKVILAEVPSVCMVSLTYCLRGIISAPVDPESV